MPIDEFISCSLGFAIVTGLLIYRHKKRSQFSPFVTPFILLPGLLIANAISWMVSKPILPNLTDQPILVGFPFSFLHLTAWSGVEFYWLPLWLNVAFLSIAGVVFGKKLLSF